MAKVVELYEVCDYKTKYGFLVINKNARNKTIENKILDAKWKAQEKYEDWTIQDLLEFLPPDWNATHSSFDLEVGV